MQFINLYRLIRRCKVQFGIMKMYDLLDDEIISSSTLCDDEFSDLLFLTDDTNERLTFLDCK